MKAAKVGTAICVASLIYTPHALATDQTLPGVIDRILEKIEIPEGRSLDDEQAAPLADKPKVKKVTDPAKVISTLKEVRFEGNNVLSDKKLHKITDTYIGKKLTKGDLAKLKHEITKSYFDKGYILVKVTTPPQSFAKGSLTVKINEAVVGDIHFTENNEIRSRVAKQIAKRAKKGKVFRERNVESMISDLNDLRDVEASLYLKPGKKVSTTDLNISIRELDEDVQSFTIDNYGSELTGELVGTLHLEHSNLLKLGERFTTDIRLSEDELWSVGIGAEIPTGIRNINFLANYQHSENDIVGRLESLGASGESDTLNLGLSSKLLNTRHHRVTVTGGLEARNHESFLFGVSSTEDDIRQLYVSGSYLYRDARSVVYTSLKLSKGTDILGASNKGDLTATRTAGEPEAWIFEPFVVAHYRPFSDGTFKLQASGQLATDTLLSSDLFIIGGFGSVRGFEPAQEAGESGYQFALEYNHEVPVHSNWNVTVGPFLDGGAVYNRIAGSTEDTHFYSAGIGIEASTEFHPLGETRFRIDWAHPLGDYTSAQVSDDTIYFRIIQEF